jgi:alpha-mannosidase
MRSGFLTSGENNVEARNENGTSYIYLTLFRSVEFLGRRDLVFRPGRASGIDEYLLRTPDAQLQTNLSFRVA